MRDWSVGIVGGGPGGLMTAYFLQKYAVEPLRATVFEASPRLGGKILTNRFARGPATYEAGAAELYDYTPVGEDALRELVEELGLPTNPMNGSAVLLDGRLLANADDIRTHLGAGTATALAEFDRLARDRISPREFYHSDEPTRAARDCSGGRFDAFLSAVRDPDARRYIDTLMHSDLATEPHRTSITYGLHNYLMNDPAYMRLYSIEGGNERLPRELAHRVRADWRLEHTVTKIGKVAGGRLAVTSRAHGRTRTDEFDTVVVALPNGYLPMIEFEGVRLQNALSHHHSHYDHPAHYLRVTVLFGCAFWRDAFADGYCMLDAFGGCCLYDESARDPGAAHGVLGWLIGGDAALEMAEWSDQQLTDAVLESLPGALGHGRKCFVEAKIHRWVGAVSAMPGGTENWSLDRRHRPEPVEHPDLFVVGDYLFDSTLNGVLDSAEYVAGWVAARMAEAPGGRA